MTDRVYPETANRNGFPKGVPKGAYYNLKEEQKSQQQPQVFQPRPPPPQSARAQRVKDDYNNGRRRRRRSTCCCCMAWTFFVLVLIIVLLGIAALVFYLVVRPKAPKYNVQDVRLSSFSIAPTGSLTSGLFQLSATTTYSVEARNPNKHIGIYYDKINIDVQSEGTSIGKGSVASFFQGHRNTTIIAGELKSSNLPLASTVGSALQAAEKAGNIPLKVYVDVRVRIKVGAVKTPHFWVHVRCNVNVNPNLSGSQVLSKKCSVKS